MKANMTKNLPGQCKEVSHNLYIFHIKAYSLVLGFQVVFTNIRMGIVSS